LKKIRIRILQRAVPYNPKSPGLQVYQFRHLSITPPATHTGLFLGLLLYVEVLGYFSDHVVFWLGFVLFYLGVTNYIILKIYRSEELAHQPESVSPKRVSIRCKEYIVRGIFLNFTY
jgi:hypothetical protein